MFFSYFSKSKKDLFFTGEDEMQYLNAIWICK